jgi:hypothetical protein
MKRWSDVLAVKRRLTGLRGLRRNRKQASDTGMYLASLGRTVPAHPDLLTPDMRVVLVEDLLWSIESEEWSRRRPMPWRRRARASWRAEGVALAEKRERIQTLAGS